MLINPKKGHTLNSVHQGSELLPLSAYLYSFQTLNGEDASWSALKWMRFIMLMDISSGQNQNKSEILTIKGSKEILCVNELSLRF